MNKHDLRQLFLSKSADTTRFCVQAMRLVLILAIALLSAALGQSASDGIRYVAPDGNNSNNGLTWSTAKATLEGSTGAVASCSTSSGSCVVHVAAAGISMSNNLVITQKQVTIECEPGAVITTAVPTGSGPAIVLEANDTRITGCAFLFSSGDVPTPLEVAAASSASVQRVTIDHNLFEDYTSSNGAVIVGDSTNNTGSIFVTDVSVTDNVFWMNSGGSINVQDNAERIDISRNRIYTGGSTSNIQVINAQTSCTSPCTGTTTIQGLTIVGNIMFNGLGGNCVQVQQLTNSGGAPISDVTVSSNICTLLPPPGSNTTTTGSGYSIAGVKGATVVGNVFDANTNSVQISGGNAPFEFVNVQNGTESGNSAVLGSQSSLSPFQIYTVIGNSGSVLNNAFTGNSASIAYTDTASGAYAVCWGVGSGGSGTNTIIRNTFTGNTCDFTSSTVEVVGFYMQGGNTGDQASNNFVSENNFIPPTTPNSAVGIVLQPESGTMQNNIVGFNNTTNFNIPYCHNLGSCSGTTGLLSSSVANLSYGSTIQQTTLH